MYVYFAVYLQSICWSSSEITEEDESEDVKNEKDEKEGEVSDDKKFDLPYGMIKVYVRIVDECIRTCNGFEYSIVALLCFQRQLISVTSK